MNSTLIDFLSIDYPFKFINKNIEPNSIRREEPASPYFEICDKKPTIEQPKGKGVAVFRNTSGYLVEVIDFEAYTHQMTPQDPEKSCDFIINSKADNSIIVFNELTVTELGYIKDFVQPITGQKREGKFSYAKGQLMKSIQRFYDVNDFLDNYDRKIALFSCRIPVKIKNQTIAQSMKSFRRTMQMNSNIRRNNWNCHGFVLQTRIYDNVFEI